MSLGILLSLIFVCAKLLDLDPIEGWSWVKVFFPLYVEIAVDIAITCVFFWVVKRKSRW